MFCLTCKHLSPPGSLYCAYCPGKRSFNAIICGNNHRCHRGTRNCPTCGNGEFSEYTCGLETGWIAKALSIALLVYLWKLGLAHSDSIFGAIGVGASYAFGFLTNSNQSALAYVLQTGLFYLAMAWVFGLWLSLMPGGGGAVGKFLRGIPTSLWGKLLRLTPRVGSLVWKGVVRISGMAPKKPGGLPGKSKSKSGVGDDL